MTPRMKIQFAVLTAILSCLAYFYFNSDTLPTHFESFVNIPIIDISPFLAEQESDASISLRQQTALQIINASMKYGSFYISIPSAVSYDTVFRNKLLTNAYKLFNISAEQKQLHSTRADNLRGFIPYGSESGNRQYFEHKESFAFGYYNWSKSKSEESKSDAQLQPQNEMEFYNVFPTQLTTGDDSSSIEPSLERMFDVFVELSNVLVKAYSLALYDDEAVLYDAFNGGETISFFRLFRYFSKKHTQHRHKLPLRSGNYLGSSPHTDWGLLTLIVGDDTPGLQIYDTAQQRWLTVVPKFNESLIFVNCGDFMSIVSDGQFVSPLHRVLLPTEEMHERMSIVFFFYPRYDAKIPASKSKRSYSLFEDQSSPMKTRNVANVTNVSEMSFGSFIKQKWKQVTKDK